MQTEFTPSFEVKAAEESENLANGYAENLIAFQFGDKGKSAVLIGKI